MKPATFKLLQPTTRSEALSALAEAPDETVILAGGQSLVPLMNMRFVTAERVLDLNGVADMVGLERANATLSVGAMTRQRDLELSAVAVEACPLLVQAQRYVGYVSTRHRGTVGGTMAHADTVAQVPCAAVALDARMLLESAQGQRWLGTEEFFVGNLMNAREPEEMLTEIRFPVRQTGARFGFAEFVRKAGDFPLVTAAVSLEFDGHTCARARVVVGGAAPTPVRLAECEQMLDGRSGLGTETIAEVAARAGGSVSPPESPFVSVAYMRNLVGVVVRQALEGAVSKGETS